MIEAKTLLVELKARYPVVAEWKPLAVGVRDELIAVGYSAEVLRRTLYTHVHGIKYKRIVAKGGKRFHLDGSEAQDIESEHIESALKSIAEYDRANADRVLRKKEIKAQEVDSRAVKTIKPEPAPKLKPAAKPSLAAKTPLAAKSPPVVAVVVKKRRVVQVPK